MCFANINSSIWLLPFSLGWGGEGVHKRILFQVMIFFDFQGIEVINDTDYISQDNIVN